MIVRWLPWMAYLILCLLGTTAYGADTRTQRFNTTVMIVVSADKDLHNLVMNHIRQELLSLEGIELVEDHPDRVVMVLAKEIKKIGGYRNGIVLSTAFATPYYYPDPTRGLSKEHDKANGLRPNYGLFFGLSQNLYIDSVDNIQSLCKKISEDFDAEQIEPRRKRLQRIN